MSSSVYRPYHELSLDVYKTARHLDVLRGVVRQLFAFRAEQQISYIAG